MTLNIGYGCVITTGRANRLHVSYLNVLLLLTSWESLCGLAGSHAELRHLFRHLIWTRLIVARCVQHITTHEAHLYLLIGFIVIQHEIINQVLHVA